MAEPTKEQQQLIALANARLRLKQAEAAPVAEQAEPAQQAAPQQRPQQNYLPGGIGRGMSPAGISAFPGEAFGFPSPEPTQQERKQAAANIVRYGAPMVATLATAPATAPTLGGAAILSGVSGASTYLADALAQYIESGDVEQRAALSAGLAASTPVVPYGGALKRMLINLPVAVGFYEGSRKVAEGEDYSMPKSTSEAFDRWKLIGGMSSLTSVISGRAATAERASKNRSAIEASRQGGGATLSEALPEYTKLESRMVKVNNKRALEAVDRMDAGFDEAIAMQYPDGVSNKPLRDFIAQKSQEIKTLRANYDAAETAARAAREKANQLSTGENIMAYAKAKREASELAFDAQAKKISYEAAQRYALGSNALNASDVGIAKQMRAVSDTLSVGREALREGINDAYAAAGIRPNTPVVSLAGVRSSISSRAKRGRAFEGKIARKETLDAVNQYFNKYGESGNISWEALQKLKTQMADDLAANGVPANSAQRIAREAYDAVNSASDRFIKKNYPEQYSAWQSARKLAARDFALRETRAMEFLANGDAKGFYGAISSEGNGETIAAISEYARLLKDSGRGDAANAFVNNVNDIVAKGVLDKASSVRIGSGADALSQLVDPATLIKELDSLRAKRFPVGALGLGTPEQIKASARLASVGKSGGITTNDLAEFLDLANELGVSKAVAKKDYFTAVRNEQIANGTRQMRKAAYEARQAAKRLNASEVDAAEALAAASEDPVVKLINDPSFKVPVGATNSAKFNASLLAMEPETASAFVDAMNKAGKGSDLENIRKGLAYGALNKRKTLQDGSSVIDHNAITDLFFKTGDPKLDNTRSVFRNIVGDEAYQAMRDNIAKPLQAIGEQRRKLAYTPGISMPSLVARQPLNQAGLKASVVGTTTGLMDLIRSARYNTLYTLYINPRTSKMYADVVKGTKPLGSQPVLATAIKLAAQEDAAAQAEQP